MSEKTWVEATLDEAPSISRNLLLSMKLWRLLITLLICWNATCVFLLLWRYHLSPAVEEVLTSNGGQLPVTLALAKNITGLSVPHSFQKFRPEHLNVPLIYYGEHDGQDTNSPKGGPIFALSTPHIRFPNVQDLHFNNVYWQTLTAGRTTFYLYGAYLDDRFPKGPLAIRILGMVDGQPVAGMVRCALWFHEGRQMVWASTIRYEHLWRAYWGLAHNGTLQPYLITCRMPSSMKASSTPPTMVSLVAKGWITPTTNLRVVGSGFNGPKEDFAVCVKGLDFPSRDLSRHLLEWVHLLRILGARKVFFYELEVHPNVARTLAHLQAEGAAEVLPLTLPGHQPNLRLLRTLFLQRMTGTKRLDEVIPYNDCLYRNLHRYAYLVLLDIDEVLMPISSDTWRGLVDQTLSIIQLNKPKDYSASSFNVRNVYFFQDMKPPEEILSSVPSFLQLSRHVVRSASFTGRGRYVKCFHDTAKVRALHNHYPLSCIRSQQPCRSFDISPLMAQLQHYRTDCHDISWAQCQKNFRNRTVLDTHIWRYNHSLTRLVARDLRILGFTSESPEDGQNHPSSGESP